MIASWYILQVYSGFEKKVSDQILLQSEKKGLRASIEEILVPSEDVIEMKKGKFPLQIARLLGGNPHKISNFVT